jgi:hypothetical protein
MELNKMSTLNNLKDFNEYINSLASKWDSEQDLHDFCHEQSDSSEHVIYYGKAWDLVNMIRIYDYSLLDEADSVLEYSEFESINQAMTLLANKIIYQSLSLSLKRLSSRML